MGCFGTFIATLIILIVVLGILSTFTQGWAFLILAAAIIAAAITAYMELDKRVEAIEKHLGLHAENDPSITEESKEDEENAP